MARAGLSVVVYLGLGSNQGDRAAALRGAVAALGARGILPRRCSPVYETEYVGPGTPQPPYLNAVVEACTDHAPLDLLRRVQEIEVEHGRAPHTHLRPRPLDVDVLLYGGWVIRHPELVVPHPRLGDRRFVLQPLHDLGVLARWPDRVRRLEALAATQRLRPCPGVELGVQRETVAC